MLRVVGQFGKTKVFILGLLAGVTLIGCAGAGFGFRYYQPELVSWSGVLRGETPEDDLDAAATCTPDEQEKGKCVVMLREEFFKLKLEHIDCKNKLSYCERYGCSPTQSLN